MNEIPVICLIAIGLAVFFLVGMNTGLLILLRDPSKWKIQRKAPRSNKSANSMSNFIKVLRDPFAEERGQLQELSSLVKELKDKQPTDKGDES